MKSRRSFMKRNSIAVLILIIIAVFSGVSTLSKEMLYRELQSEEREYLAKIKKLNNTLDEEKENLEKVDTLEFIEKYAREKLNMVKPNEFYFIINYSEEDE